MRTVFLDSVKLLALWNRSDQWHSTAKGVMLLANRPGTRFVSTPYVFRECGNAASRLRIREEVCLARDRLIQQGNLIDSNSVEIEEAWSTYRRAGSGSAGIVDELSFVVMRRLGIKEAFTNDRHFKAAGFTTLF